MVKKQKRKKRCLIHHGASYVTTTCTRSTTSPASRLAVGVVVVARLEEHPELRQRARIVQEWSWQVGRTDVRDGPDAGHALVEEDPVTDARVALRRRGYVSHAM